MDLRPNANTPLMPMLSCRRCGFHGLNYASNVMMLLIDRALLSFPFYMVLATKVTVWQLSHLTCLEIKMLPFRTQIYDKEVTNRIKHGES